MKKELIISVYLNTDCSWFHKCKTWWWATDIQQTTNQLRVSSFLYHGSHVHHFYTKVLQFNDCVCELLPQLGLECIHLRTRANHLRTVEWFDLFYLSGHFVYLFHICYPWLLIFDYFMMFLFVYICICLYASLLANWVFADQCRLSTAKIYRYWGGGVCCHNIEARTNLRNTLNDLKNNDLII